MSVEIVIGSLFVETQQSSLKKYLWRRYDLEEHTQGESIPHWHRSITNPHPHVLNTHLYCHYSQFTGKRWVLRTIFHQWMETEYIKRNISSIYSKTL